MYRTRTENRIDDVVMWSALAVYAAVWMVGVGLGLGGEWLLAGWAAVVYVGMHVFEITRRSHCYLSADSTACPVSLLLFSLAVVGMWAAGHPPLPGKPIWLAWGIYFAVFMGGHLAALGYSAALETALTFVFRGRIAAEREYQAEQSVAPDCGGIQ